MKRSVYGHSSDCYIGRTISSGDRLSPDPVIVFDTEILIMSENNEKDSIVVLQTPKLHGVECVRSLSRAGVHTIAVASSRINPAVWSRYTDESLVIPSPNNDLSTYSDILQLLAQRTDVRTILPVSEPDIYVLAKHRPELARYVSPLWPSLETLNVAHDRLRMAEAAMNAGIPVPVTRPLGEADSIEGDLIVKPRYALLTNDYVDSYDENTCRRISKTKYFQSNSEIDHQALQTEFAHEPIVQEFVSGAGVEYSCRVLCDHGEPVVASMKRQLRGDSYAGGGSVYRESMYDSRLKELTTTLLEAIDWHGIASVEFLKDTETGEFMLMEINPRFPGSLSMDLQAGVDFPRYYYELATGTMRERDPQSKIGVATHDILGELRYLWSVMWDEYPVVERPSRSSAAWEVATSLIKHPHLDGFSYDDPTPFALSSIARVADYHSNR